MNLSDHYLCTTLKDSVRENSLFTARIILKIYNILPYFEDSSSVMCPEIFSVGARPAQKLEIGNSRLFYEIR